MQVSVPTLTGLTSVDRYGYVVGAYALDYSVRWSNWAYLLIFIAFFQVCVAYITKVKRFIVR